MIVTDKKLQVQKNAVIEYLNRPENKGKRISINRLANECGMAMNTMKRRLGMAWVVEQWMAINPDAPERVKAYFRNLAVTDNNYSQDNPDEVIVTRKNPETGAQEKKRFSVPMEKASVMTANLSRGVREAMKEDPDIGRAEVKVELAKTKPIAKQADEFEFELHRIKEAFVTAEMGTIPNIRRIMVDFGILDKSGKPALGSPKELTEDFVRRRMLEENWKGERERWLHRTFDVLPDEIRMVTIVRNLEVQKLLYDEIKLLHNANMKYYVTGKVTTVDGKKELEGYRPDHAVIAALAETMRRMTMSDGVAINILVQNHKSTDSGPVNPLLSVLPRSVINEFASMDLDTLKREVEKYQALNTMLQKGEITVLDVENMNTMEGAS